MAEKHRRVNINVVFDDISALATVSDTSRPINGKTRLDLQGASRQSFPESKQGHISPFEIGRVGTEWMTIVTETCKMLVCICWMLSKNGETHPMIGMGGRIETLEAAVYSPASLSPSWKNDLSHHIQKTHSTMQVHSHKNKHIKSYIHHEWKVYCMQNLLKPPWITQQQTKTCTYYCSQKEKPQLTILKSWSVSAANVF